MKYTKGKVYKDVHLLGLQLMCLVNLSYDTTICSVIQYIKIYFHGPQEFAMCYAKRIKLLKGWEFFTKYGEVLVRNICSHCLPMHYNKSNITYLHSLLA